MQIRDSKNRNTVVCQCICFYLCTCLVMMLERCSQCSDPLYLLSLITLLLYCSVRPVLSSLSRPVPSCLSCPIPSSLLFSFLKKKKKKEKYEKDISDPFSLCLSLRAHEVVLVALVLRHLCSSKSGVT